MGCRTDWGQGDMAYKTGEYPRVEAIIASIEVSKTWEAARSLEAAYMYQIRAAQNMGIFQPFSDEQNALNDYLTSRQAGLRLCDYAWRLFVQSMD